jgi:hypothetical protein
MNDYPRELQHGSGVVMVLDVTRLLLAFEEVTARAEVETVLRGLGLALEDASDRQPPRSPRPMFVVNHTNRRFWIRSLLGQLLGQTLIDAVETAFGEKLDWIGPVYRLGSTKDQTQLLCPLPNVLVIKPALLPDQKIDPSFSGRLSQFGLKEIPEKSRYLSGFRYYVCTEPKENSAYRIRSILLDQEKQFIREVRFETMPLLVPSAVVPNDLLFPQQWDMAQIGAGGVGLTGWDISTGANTVVLCVLDEGCDLTHPDLQFSTPGINLGTMMPDGSPTGNHGTACAGIAAARFDNALGVAGVAGNCQIMPLAVATWSDVEIAAGVNFAADNGAQVISRGDA